MYKYPSLPCEVIAGRRDRDEDPHRSEAVWMKGKAGPHSVRSKTEDCGALYH